MSFCGGVLGFFLLIVLDLAESIAPVQVVQYFFAAFFKSGL